MTLDTGIDGNHDDDNDCCNDHDDDNDCCNDDDDDGILL